MNIMNSIARLCVLAFFGGIFSTLLIQSVLRWLKSHFFIGRYM